MKNFLLFISLFFAVQHLAAQDTLYLQGRKEPVLVNILKVKNKTIEYNKYGGSSDKTLTVSRDRVARFGYKPTEEQLAADAADLADLTTPYVRKTHTFYLATRGLLGLPTVGAYYDHSLYTNASGSLNIGGFAGGGLVNAGESENRTVPTGRFIELGSRLETGKNRLFFHSGMNVRKEFYNFDSMVESVVLGIPFGATFRANTGAYLSAGGELHSRSWAEPLFRLRFGWSF